METGDKVVLIPIRGGGYAAVVLATPEEGDKCLVVPAFGGGKVAVKLATPESGDKVLVYPLADGGYVCLKSSTEDVVPCRTLEYDPLGWRSTYFYDCYGAINDGWTFIRCMTWWHTLTSYSEERPYIALPDPICKLYSSWLKRWFSRDEIMLYTRSNLFYKHRDEVYGSGSPMGLEITDGSGHTLSHTVNTGGGDVTSLTVYNECRIELPKNFNDMTNVEKQWVSLNDGNSTGQPQIYRWNVSD